MITNKDKKFNCKSSTLCLINANETKRFLGSESQNRNLKIRYLMQMMLVFFVFKHVFGNKFGLLIN